VEQQGIEFQITVVDDGSTDQTRELAESFAGVRVIAAAEPANGVSGKCNALITGAKGARAKWLLFTDADTIHAPGSLAAAVRKAEEDNLDLLSYSPEQTAVTLSEMALMPVVFGELMRVYPPDAVNDPANPTVAANGQYLLVRRAVYESLGGHGIVADKILEDVELARLFKYTGAKIRFESGAGRVKTRMYRNFSTMIEGWTKNLALLFPNTLPLALARALEFSAIMGSCIAGSLLLAAHHQAGAILLATGIAFYAQFTRRIRQARFCWRSNLAALFGEPLFAWLLLRSYLHWNIEGAVAWKGRRYSNSEPPVTVDSSTLEEILRSKG
jgi:cellulose synthase/poly-beta-1,6-N-acetylglucosamine synthase-like glycosyltransferase